MQIRNIGSIEGCQFGDLGVCALAKRYEKGKGERERTQWEMTEGEHEKERIERGEVEKIKRGDGRKRKGEMRGRN